MTKSKRSRGSGEVQTNSPAEPITIKIVVPKRLCGANPLAAWLNGGSGRRLGKLASDAATGEATLSPDELADLVDDFKDERPPPGLVQAVGSQLRGKRVRRQGAPKARQTSLEQIELLMLPEAYRLAREEVKEDRKKLSKQRGKPSRRQPAEPLPTISNIACELVRKRLPTLKHLSDRGLQNLVSEVKELLAEGDAAEDAEVETIILEFGPQ